MNSLTSAVRGRRPRCGVPARYYGSKTGDVMDESPSPTSQVKAKVVVSHWTDGAEVGSQSPAMSVS